uniref:Myb/SANT-like DNA-binding domain-containing protein n=1 Tax=Kalanchoe fedtschenkoi TaxID=63787 RepID=A0A7N0TED7_KALFE
MYLKSCYEEAQHQTAHSSLLASPAHLLLLLPPSIFTPETRSSLPNPKIKISFLFPPKFRSKHTPDLKLQFSLFLNFPLHPSSLDLFFRSLILMDDSEQNTRYPQMRFPVTSRHQPTYGSQSSRSLVPVRNQTHLRPVNFTRFKEDYGEDEVDDDEDSYEIEETGYGGMNGGRADFSRGGLEEEEYGNGNRIEFGGGLERNSKKRKMKSVMDYEDGGSANGGGSRELGARNGIREWSEHETFLLLEAWGDRYLQLGRKSLRSDDWKELAEKVSEASEIDRSDVECRNKMDTLKKRYRKEKAKMEQNYTDSMKGAFSRPVCWPSVEAKCAGNYGSPHVNLKNIC